MKKIVVDPEHRGWHLGLGELFSYRDLFFVLAYRDFRVRYAQTFLGFAWAFIQPLVTLVILTVVFGKVAKVDTGGVPYPLFAICGMSAWTYFAFVLGQAGQSIINAQSMVTKIYFPRLVIPLSKALVGLIDFLITFVLIIILMIVYRCPPSADIVFLPVFVLMTIVAALAVGIWMSALTIRYRDFQHILPFIVQFGFYITPTAYPAESVIRALPKWAAVIYFLNPMAGVVQGFRWCLLGGTPPGGLACISFVIAGILFVSALFYFKKVERVIADII